MSQREKSLFFLTMKGGLGGLVYKGRDNSWILIAVLHELTDTFVLLRPFFFKWCVHAYTPTCKRKCTFIKKTCTCTPLSPHGHTKSTVLPLFSGLNKCYHPSMSAHRLICCLSPCRESALVRYKATQGNSSLSPKPLVWQSAREEENEREERLIEGEGEMEGRKEGWKRARRGAVW